MASSTEPDVFTKMKNMSTANKAKYLAAGGITALLTAKLADSYINNIANNEVKLEEYDRQGELPSPLPTYIPPVSPIGPVEFN